MLNVSNKNTCIIKKSKSKYENTTAGHVNPEKPILEKKKKWGLCTPSQCYGAAFWVLRLSSLYKYEKKLSFKSKEITS